MSLVSRIIRPVLKKLIPYQSARRTFSLSANSQNNTIWLNANERAQSDDYQLDTSLFNRYPDFQPDELIENYANYAGVNKEQVLATRGADEGIELLIRTFCQESPLRNSDSDTDSILINPPTYGMYAISAKTCGINVVEVPATKDLSLNTQGIIEQADKVKIVFICSPNNPTGNLISQSQIKEVLSAYQNKAILVCDEAYIEYCPEASQVDLLKQYSNLVILRTLSKAFGLAGLRCGFTLANEEIINALKKVIAPYPIPAPVAQVAIQALTQSGIQQMQKGVKETLQVRAQLIEKLQTYSFVETIFESQTNYVLARVKDKEKVFNALVNAKIYIRDQSKQISLDNCVRFTIGSQQEMNAVYAVLDNL